MALNIEGSFNTAIGSSALEDNTGDNNTAVGSEALFANAGGINNTAVGSDALSTNVTGSNNTALGYNAQVTEGFENSTAIGAGAIVDASDALVLGEVGVVNVGIGTSIPTARLHIVGGDDPLALMVDGDVDITGAVNITGAVEIEGDVDIEG